MKNRLYLKFIVPSAILLLARCHPPIRKSIASLTPAEIVTFRHGIDVMKSRNPADLTTNPATWDKTSLAYQSWIHGTVASFNQCEHGTEFFLSWHRMYLFYFERILRKASGDSKFGLPYWNYTDPAQRHLPDAFRIPADATNPLYIPDGPTWTADPPHRQAGVNSGAYALSAVSVSTSGFMPLVTFFTPSGMQRQMELTPHNAVHGSLGATMGSSNSADDPIFWLHHCNIDRLWTTWLAQGGGRQFPTSDATWLNQSYSFADENGNPVTMTGTQMLFVDPGSYRYDDEADPDIPGIRLTEPIKVSRLQITDSIRLGLKRFTATFPMPTEIRSLFDSAAKGNLRDLVLQFTFGDIHLQRNPDLFYEVYFDLPGGTLESVQYTNSHYAGNLAFFGFPTEGQHQHHPGEAPSITLSMTNNFTSLIERKELSPEKITISFVPRGLVDNNGNDILPNETPEVRIGSISVAISRIQK